MWIRAELTRFICLDKTHGAFFAYFCLRTFSLYADYEIHRMEMLTQSTVGHLHIYKSFGLELWYVLTMLLGPAGTTHPGTLLKGRHSPAKRCQFATNAVT